MCCVLSGNGLIWGYKKFKFFLTFLSCFTSMSSRWRRYSMANRWRWTPRRCRGRDTWPPCPHSPGASLTARYSCLSQFVCRAGRTQPGHETQYKHRDTLMTTHCLVVSLSGVTSGGEYTTHSIFCQKSILKLTLWGIRWHLCSASTGLPFLLI